MVKIAEERKKKQKFLKIKKEEILKIRISVPQDSHGTCIKVF